MHWASLVAYILNLLFQGTAAHGETYLEPVSPQDSTPSSGASFPSMSGNHDRKGVPLPTVPESSVRRDEKVDSYLEPTPTNTLRKDWNWNDDPANQNISTIAHTHYQPQFIKESDRQTYLEPTNSYHDDFNLGITLNPNRQTADFTRGISLKFEENRRESGDSNSNRPPSDTNYGNVSSGILLNPSEQDSGGTKTDPVPFKSAKNIKSKSEKKKKKDRLSLQNTESDMESSSTKEMPNPGKKRGSIQFTDDIYLQIEQDSSSA